MDGLDIDIPGSPFFFFLFSFFFLMKFWGHLSFLFVIHVSPSLQKFTYPPQPSLSLSLIFQSALELSRHSNCSVYHFSSSYAINVVGYYNLLNWLRHLLNIYDTHIHWSLVHHEYMMTFPSILAFDCYSKGQIQFYAALHHGLHYI